MRHFRSEFSFHKQRPNRGGWFGFLKSSKKRDFRVDQAPPFQIHRRNTAKRELFGFSRKKFHVLLFILFVVAWVGLLLFLPFFRINSITTAGLAIIKESEVTQAVQEYLEAKNLIGLPRNNYFLLRTDPIVKHLQEVFSINNVTVAKIFPHEIHISLEEKVSSIVYDTGSKYYLLDQNGGVIKQIILENSRGNIAASTSNQLTGTSSIEIMPLRTSTLTVESPGLNRGSKTVNATSTTSTAHIPDYKEFKKEFGDYPIVYYSRLGDFTEKQQTPLTASFIKGIASIYNALKGERGLLPYYFIVKTEPRAGITVVTSKNWTIEMQPLADVSIQMLNLKTITQNNQPSEYIDLRFGNRVYWK